MAKKGKGQSTEASGQPAQTTAAKAVSEVKKQQTPGNKTQVTKQDNNSVQSSKVESVATPVIQTPKVVANEQAKKPEEVKKEEKAQVFGLYFHNSKVLSTFLFYAIGIIAVPIATYIFSNGYLSKIPEISQNQAQIYSGFFSVGVVGLFLLGYCTFAITDESNFKQEQSQYEALAEQSKQKKDKESKKQTETAVVSEVKEIAPKKPVEVAQNKQEAPKKQDTKKEKTPESQVASAGTAKQDVAQSKKKEQSVSSVKENTAASNKKEPQSKSTVKPQQDNLPKKEQQKQQLEKPQEPSKPTLKNPVQEAEDDSWNEVKAVGKKGKKAGSAVASTKSKVEKAEEKVSPSNNAEEEDDGFIIVRQKKTPVVE